MRPLWLAAISLASLMGLGALDVDSFRFTEDLACLQAQETQGLRFCILGDPRTSRGAMPAVFRRRPEGGFDELWRDTDRGLRPWKLLLVELDGDALPEIALGVYKATRHDPRMGKRLFIYRWTGSALAPAWLGSSLALPLVDFTFTADRDEERRTLLALERAPAGLVLRRYRWNGFGFVGGLAFTLPEPLNSALNHGGIL